MNKFIVLTVLILSVNNLLAQQESAQPIPVSVIEVVKSDALLTQDLSGNITAYKTVEVRARVDGIVEQRLFTEGSFVNKGDVLFKLEDTILQAELEVKKAVLENTIANSELVIKTFARYKNLLDKGVVSQQEYDTYEIEYKQAQAQIKQAQATLKIAKINLAYTTIKAPINGRIDKALINEGGLAIANNTKLAIIEQLDKVYVDFTQSSSQLDNLRYMQKPSINADKNITLFFNNGHKYQEKAQLQFSSMKIDKTTGAISLRGLVKNSDNLLLPGMFVRLKLPILNKQNIIKVPQKAVHMLHTGPSVYLVKDNKLTPISVSLGGMLGQDWIINSGLAAGQRVVVSDITIISQLNMPVVGMTKEEIRHTQKSK